MTEKRSKQRKQERRRSQIARVASRSNRTTQEALVADMLRAVGIPFREQWILESCGEIMIFDFLIKDTILVEGSYSNHRISYSAWSQLKRRAAYHDYKFRLAKQVGTFTTISLLEATSCTRPGETPDFPFPHTAQNYQSTDFILTTITALGEHLIGITLQTSQNNQPTPHQEDLSRWQASGKVKSSRPPKGE